MKKPAQDLKSKNKKNKSGYHKEGVWFSLLRGVMSVLPVVILLVVVGMEIEQPVIGKEREAFLRLGEKSDSPTGLYQVAKVAAKSGDLESGKYYLALAEKKNQDSPILGLSSELEEFLWPERRLEREWEKIVGWVEAGNSAKVLLRGALIWWQLGDGKLAGDLWQKAWEIDPNDEQTERVRALIN